MHSSNLAQTRFSSASKRPKRVFKQDMVAKTSPKIVEVMSSGRVAGLILSPRREIL
jgi:hypothetical protein